MLKIMNERECAVPENIHFRSTEGIGISWVARGSVRPKNSKKCMKLNWNFQRGVCVCVCVCGGGGGGGVLEKIPSVGYFSGITQFK